MSHNKNHGVELRMYKDLDVLRNPTIKDSVYFVYSSATQKVIQIWVTTNQNIPKPVELNAVSIFNPGDYDLDEFTNISIDPFVRLSELPSITTIRRQEFQYTGGSQIFTLPNDYYQVFSVEVQGQGALSLSQYNLISPNQVEIIDTLNTNDYVVILYGEDLLTTAAPYYTQAEIDSLLGQNSRVFNETPSGALNGINATYTSLYNFIPETVEVFLNGMFQKKVDDYHTIGANTITMVTSPQSTETILINYIKL